MKRPTARAVVLATALLQACAPMPQNAEEFRKAVPGAMMAKTESYEVNRAIRDVAATFRRKAPECLNVSVRTVSQTVVADAYPMPANRTRMQLYGPSKGYDVLYRAIPRLGDRRQSRLPGHDQDRMRLWLAALGVHSVDAQCRTEYLGTVALDKPAVALGIPAGRWSYLVFDFATSRYLGASRGRISRETLLKPRAGYRYEIDVTYRDDIYDVVIREQAPRGAGREVPILNLTSCRNPSAGILE